MRALLALWLALELLNVAVAMGGSSPSRSHSNSDPDAIFFPGAAVRRPRRRSTARPASPRQRTSSARDNATIIPLSLIQQLNDLNNFDDFADRFIANKEDFYHSLAENDHDLLVGGLSLRFGESDTPKPIQAKVADCSPQPTVVAVELDEPTTSFLYPGCVRLDRCSGCCNTAALECQPTRTEEQLYKISVFEMSSNGKLKFKHSRTIPLDKHIKCKCGCRMKSEDCSQLQLYRPDLCKCVCLNGSEKETCEDDLDKMWSEETCTCRCANTYDCSTGAYFDRESCRCRMN